MTNKVYNIYSEYLKNKYGEKVYKLPISLPLTCPNRDGKITRGGCIFCGEKGGSFENLSCELSIKQQLEVNRDYIGKKYKAKKFIAYFQSFTNTYISNEMLKNNLEAVLNIDKIIGISISTRPDSINIEQMEILNDFQNKNGIFINVELGLQTSNYHTLKLINRGHGLSEYIDAMINLNKYNLRTTTHVILNFPWDNIEDNIETARIISALKGDEVKIHALYVVKGTALEKIINEENISLITKDDYIKRVIIFLRNLSPDIIVQRIIGRAPEEEADKANWGTSWWKIRDEIIETMVENGWQQGDLFNYLDGKALK